ncbi:peptidylprolyl isomerase [bacterium]|jgi:peptidyl-prolyl cis-trans isomerase B (cyclophilin B)|nr:peptidylprolyl isomerase [bacterium]NBX49261.1 peptidylprolyl isomerase [bacterium]
MRGFFSLLFVGGCLLLVGAGCAASPLALTPREEVSSPDENTEITPSAPMPQWSYQGQLPQERITGKIARISTKYGDISIRLFADTAPLTVSNFVYLAESDYFNGLIFHRREEGFVIQGGDPQGNGTGGPGYTFEDELNDDYTYKRGIVAMANRGPDTNGSQFFIMLDDAPLPKAYSIFGEVIEGMEVVDQIRRGDVMTEVTIVADAQE